jgi:hypothetical protein
MVKQRAITIEFSREDEINQLAEDEKLMERISDLAAKKMVSDPKLTYSKAFTQVLEENPDIAEIAKARREKMIKEEIMGMDTEKALNLRTAEFSSFCEKLVKDGRITPTMKPAAMDFMEILSDISEFEFTEGNGKVKMNPLARFKAFLKSLSPASPGEKINMLVEDKMKANKKLTYSMAFSEVQKENPSLITEHRESFKER